MSTSNNRILSFKYALEGIKEAIKEEPNFKIHLLAGFLVIVAGILLQLSRLEWATILILIGLVISVELTNTALEAAVDSFTSENHPGAKLAKDISAGAVLVAAITSLAVGLVIFLPHIWVLNTGI